MAAMVLICMLTSHEVGIGGNKGGDGVDLPPLRSRTETRYTEIIGRSPRHDLIFSGPQGFYGECEVRPAMAPSHPITPTFTASYPGSGAKMTWNLIEAMTGLVTGDDFQLNGHEKMVSIKTHYPSHEGKEVPGAENIPRAILLVRNPLHSIPSYHNYLYEMEKRLENHSTRAPLKEWMKWRDKSFDGQLQVWKKHMEYWVDSYTPVNRLILAYERLTDTAQGPGEAMRMAEFLSRSEGVTTRDSEEIPCVWFKVVKYKEAQAKRREDQQMKALPQVDKVQAQVQPRRLQEVHMQQAQGPQQGMQHFSEVNPINPKSHRDGPSYIAPFTDKQLRDIIQVLSTLLEKYRYERSLAPVLVEYTDEVQRRITDAAKDNNVNEGESAEKQQQVTPQQNQPPPPLQQPPPIQHQPQDDQQPPLPVQDQVLI